MVVRTRSPLATVPCRACARPIRLVRLLGTGSGTWVPLEPSWDPGLGVPPSHALSTGRRTCRALRRDESLDPTEHPALIHHAVCPARHPDPAEVDLVEVDITGPAR